MVYFPVNKILSVAQVEEELRVSNAALKAISQGVVISNADHLIISTNKAFADITQYPMMEILNVNCKFLQGIDTDPQTLREMHNAVHAGKEFFGEVLNYKKDGTPFWNELSISPIKNDHGEVTHFVGITRDITQNKKLQTELLLQLSETERMNKLMVDREMKMIELKKRVEELEQELSLKV